MTQPYTISCRFWHNLCVLGADNYTFWQLSPLYLFERNTSQHGYSLWRPKPATRVVGWSKRWSVEGTRLQLHQNLHVKLSSQRKLDSLEGWWRAVGAGCISWGLLLFLTGFMCPQSSSGSPPTLLCDLLWEAHFDTILIFLRSKVCSKSPWTVVWFSHIIYWLCEYRSEGRLMQCHRWNMQKSSF